MMSWDKSQDKFGRELTIADDESLVLWFGQLFRAIREKDSRNEKDTGYLQVNHFGLLGKSVCRVQAAPKFEFKPQKH